MEYRLVEENYSFDLTKKVNELIKLGWKPQGGLIYWANGFNDHYKQAMIKE
jgi:hypothetical protein